MPINMKHCTQPYLVKIIQASLFVSHLLCVHLFLFLFLFFTTRYQHEFAQIILVEDEDSQDYIFNHMNTPQYQSGDYTEIMRRSQNVLGKHVTDILAGHPVLRGYWSQRRFLKDLVNWFNNAAYED
ncbi:hypothetical protein GQ457_18G017270 [Hibiscus cannabinus]